MTKKDHDESVAVKRKIDYNKPWFIAAVKAIRETRMENFALLDMGCGNGEFSEIARRKFNAEITCLDYSENHLRRINQLGFQSIKCNFDNSEDIDRVSHEFEKKFDLIVSLEVIEHVFDVDAFIAAAHALLKENGLLIISTPNMDYISHRIYSMFRGNIPVGEGHHIRFFNVRRLEQVLVLDGFEVLKRSGFGSDMNYVERAIGEKKNSFRAAWVRAIYHLLEIFTGKSSSMRNSGLLFVARKSGTKPIGFDPMFRDLAYDRLSLDEKRAAIEKIAPLRNMRFFDEHPGLIGFIDEESAKLIKDKNACRT